MKKTITVLLLICGLITANAQNADKKWALGIFGGKTEYNGDFGNGFLEFGNELYGFGGGSINRYLSKSFDINLQGTFGTYGYYKDAVKNFKGKKADGNLLLVYKLNNGYIFNEKAKLSPFINAGIGLANNWSYSGSKLKGGYDFLYSFGGGLKYNILEDFAFQYQFLYNFTNSDERDYWVAKNNDNFMAHSLGFVFSFGAPKDSDKDGVPDKLDNCPNTPAGVKVDINGCPLDTDNDGVADYLDKCPTIKGISAFKGCPDTDGDGIQDSEDKCPAVKGIAAFSGCPDSDGDGIQDSEDKCPNVKGLKEFSGCPDTDGDGITDAEDRCPNAKGSKELKGCPDKDKDGVADIDDKCPDVPGIKENKGCPEVKAEVKKVFAQALQGIQFETGKDVILKGSYPILDQVVKVMNENKEYNLEINGHTDNVGKDNLNLLLSQKRANAVKAYLVKKGIDENRMKATGYGSTMPVEDNKTAAGKAKNRRVEFKVNF